MMVLAGAAVVEAVEAVKAATHLSDTFFPLLVTRRTPFVQLNLKTLQKLQLDLLAAIRGQGTLDALTAWSREQWQHKHLLEHLHSLGGRPLQINTALLEFLLLCLLQHAVTASVVRARRIERARIG
jgi:hypothetical protein